MKPLTQLNLNETPAKNSPTHNTSSETKRKPSNIVAMAAAAAGALSLAVLLAAGGCSKHESAPVSMTPSSQPLTPTPAVLNSLPTPPVATPQPTPKKKVAKPRPTTATYVNRTYGVSLTYPRKYSLKVGDEAQMNWDGLGPVPMDFVKPGGVNVAAVELPHSSYPGTDFTSAFVNLSVNPTLTAEECSQFAFPDVTQPGTEPASKVKVGTTEFDAIEDFAGQATQQAEVEYYHVFQNGACYEFGLGLGTAGFGTSDAIKSVDRKAVFSKLDKILATVKIQSTAVPAAEAPVQSMTSSPETPTGSVAKPN